MSAVASPDKFVLAGKYRLIAEIGRGGMADVYLAAAHARVGGFQKLVVVKVDDLALQGGARQSALRAGTLGCKSVTEGIRHWGRLGNA